LLGFEVAHDCADRDLRRRTKQAHAAAAAPRRPDIPSGGKALNDLVDMIARHARRQREAGRIQPAIGCGDEPQQNSQSEIGRGEKSHGGYLQLVLTIPV